MWFFVLIGMLLVLALFAARLNSAYHPDLIFKKHLVIRRAALAKFFISSSNPCSYRMRNRKEYRNKLLVSGVVFYSLWVCVLFFSVFFLRFGPTEPIEPIVVRDTQISVYKNAVVFLLLLIFIGMEFSFSLLNVSRSPSVSENKWIAWFYRFVLFFLFSICICGVVVWVRIVISL